MATHGRLGDAGPSRTPMQAWTRLRGSAPFLQSLLEWGGVVDLGHESLAAESLAAGAGSHEVAQIGCNHDVVAVREVAQRPAEDFLAGALRVDVRGC